MSIIKRGNKKTIAIRIKNKTIYIDILFVDAVALQYFGKKYEYSSNKTQISVKNKIRSICNEEDTINTNSVRNSIFLHFLPLKIKKLLK